MGTYAITQGTLRPVELRDQLHRRQPLHHEAQLTVTANPQTKIYGSADPALTYGVPAWSTATLGCVHGALRRATGEDVGSYAITQGTLSAGANYAINFTGANLSITPALLTVTANPQSKTTARPIRR